MRTKWASRLNFKKTKKLSHLGYTNHKLKLILGTSTRNLLSISPPELRFLQKRRQPESCWYISLVWIVCEEVSSKIIMVDDFLRAEAVTFLVRALDRIMCGKIELLIVILLVNRLILFLCGGGCGSIRPWVCEVDYRKLESSLVEVRKRNDKNCRKGWTTMIVTSKSSLRNDNLPSLIHA